MESRIETALNGPVATKKATKTENGIETIVIPKIQPKIIELEIVGVTPLIVCSWSHKAMQQILDKQMKKAVGAKSAKDPNADFMASRYISTEGWDGIPAGGVKGCLVAACRAVSDIPMTLAKRLIFIHADGQSERKPVFEGVERPYGVPLVRVNGTPQIHEGMVRIDNGKSTDIRYRALYPEWSMKLTIEFLANIISAEQVANLVELSGFIEGLCEHRPGAPKSCTGDSGRFCIRRE